MQLIRTEDLNRLADTGERIEFLALVTASATAAFLALKKAVESLAVPIAEYQEWQKATMDLTEQQLELIQVMEMATGVNDTQVAELFQLATAYGVAEDKIDDFVSAALGLSDAVGVSANTALQKLAEFMNGNSKALDTFLPQLRQAETELEKLAIIEEVAADSLETMRDALTDSEGAQLRFNQSLRELHRVIGEGVAPSVTVVFNSLAALAELLANNLLPMFSDWNKENDRLIKDLTRLSGITDFWVMGLTEF